MPRPNDDDLFKDSTMTFGEHLEDLRGSLLRAVLGLAIGFGIGVFWLGDRVMEAIQAPLVSALGRFYVNRAASPEHYKKVVDELTALGFEAPESFEQLSAQARRAEMTYEFRLVDVVALRKAIGLPPREAPVKTDNANTPPPDGATPDTQQTDKPPPEPVELAPLPLWTPVNTDPRVSMKVFNAIESFSIWLKAAFIGGAILSSPWVFYQIWLFVAAGLYPHERKYVYVFLPFSLGLFLAGVATAYFLVFSPVLDFLLGFGMELGLEPEPRITEWLSFVLLLPIGFGLGFQLPLVMLFLERIGVFDIQAYLSKWRIAVLVIFIAAAVLTPADPYSMLLMAVPMTFLYGVGVLLCRFFPRPKPA